MADELWLLSALSMNEKSGVGCAGEVEEAEVVCWEWVVMPDMVGVTQWQGKGALVYC